MPIVYYPQVDSSFIFRMLVRDPTGAIADLSAITTDMFFMFAPPTLPSFEKQCDFTTDGSDGLVECEFSTGEVNEAGDWKVQLDLTSTASGFNGFSRIVRAFRAQR